MFGRVIVSRAIVVIGIVGAACLERPIGTIDPQLPTGWPTPATSQRPDKVDLLFMIDNSPSMGDKQALLADAVPDMVTRLVTPNCVDSLGNAVGQSDGSGQCAAGKLEFPPVHDMHIGIVTSSLGGRGGNQCPPDAANEANPNLNAHNDDHAHLIARGGDAEIPVANALPFNFLAWYPKVAANQANPSSVGPPVPPETTAGAPGMDGTLIGDFASMIQGVHEHGCGFEAQNEAWYRFLVQPDPFDRIDIQDNRANLTGIDATILQQRKAFLRPDSIVVVIVVTDENEEVANPVSVEGEGWAYESSPFPGSPSLAAPEGTIECQSAPGPMSGPNDPNCMSCAFQGVQAIPNFAALCPNDPPNGVQGFLDLGNDGINVRFFQQKKRFGVFAGYPIARYVRGLTAASVPDRRHEVDGHGDYVGDQDKYANCVNPVFAQDLPTDQNADLCHLARGPRTPDMIYYAAIAGVPHQLFQARSGVDPECPAGTPQADCPQKNALAETDWQSITGKDPEHGDFSGADPHMVESEEARAGISCGPNANDDCDPVHGREWNTNRNDLEFACIFPIVDPTTGTPTPKDCTLPQYAGACDCAAGSDSQDSPLCEVRAGVHTTMQTNAKAYASIREMAIAHAMASSASGNQGIASSVCPIHVAKASPGDPLSGYRPAVGAIVDRLSSALGLQCLPQKLPLRPTGEVPCRIMVTLSKPSSESQCSSITGLSIPPADILSRFRAAAEAAWQASGGIKSNLPDPNTLPVCQLNQLTTVKNMNDFGPDGTCRASTEPGWCYVEGQAAGGCPQQILFTANEPPSGSTVNLQCSESYPN